LEGLSLRAVARILSVNPQSVANWVTAHQSALEQHGQLSLPPAHTVVAEAVELDEGQVFVGAHKGEKTLGVHGH
jgi:transposase-like protein